MTDKEMIEEMGEIIRTVFKKKTDMIFIPDIGKPIAQKLFKNKYRKLDDHAIMTLRKAKGLEERARKETAREILEWISDTLTENIGYTGWLDSYFGDKFQNLCKKYGLKAIQTQDGVEVE